MNGIIWKTGNLFDLLDKVESRKIVLPHVCNDVGAWGRGFVVPLGQRFPCAKDRYLESFANEDFKLALGCIQIVPVSYIGTINGMKSVSVCNMIAQHRLISDSLSRPPIRYVALADCMKKVAAIAEAEEAEIHAPKFGAGLSGGQWEFIEELIRELWLDRKLSVTIYKLE
jgi:hypothetical protein